MSSFSVSTFDELTGQQLQEYMEPLMASGELLTTREQFSHLFDALARYDHYHLVYALDMCARYDISASAMVLPQMLSHVEGSVVCAALNILDSMPAESVTPDLLRRLESVSVPPNWYSLVNSIQSKLRNRLLTNR